MTYKMDGNNLVGTKVTAATTHPNLLHWDFTRQRFKQSMLYLLIRNCKYLVSLGS